jgi:hypothetical protein
MNGHGNARSIAKIYDVFVNDLIQERMSYYLSSQLKNVLLSMIVELINL